MAARYVRFVRGELTPDERAEVAVVDGIAARLTEYLASEVPVTVERSGSRLNTAVEQFPGGRKLLS